MVLGMCLSVIIGVIFGVITSTKAVTTPAASSNSNSTMTNCSFDTNKTITKLPLVNTVNYDQYANLTAN